MKRSEVRPARRNWKEFRRKKDAPEFRSAYAQRRLELELAAIIREWRLRRGISQAELARRVGTQQSAIARLEGGGDNITVSRLGRIAEFLGAEVSIRLKPKAARI